MNGRKARVDEESLSNSLAHVEHVYLTTWPKWFPGLGLIFNVFNMTLPFATVANAQGKSRCLAAYPEASISVWLILAVLEDEITETLQFP